MEVLSMAVPWIALATTAASLLGEWMRTSSEKKARRDILSQIERAKYTEEDKNRLLGELDRSFNTQALNETNRAALGISNILNKDTAKGLLASRLLGERASRRLDLISKIDEFNRKLELEKAQVPPVEGFNINAGISGFVQGLLAENVFSELFKGQDNNNQNKSVAETLPTMNVDLKLNSKSNPYLLGGIISNDYILPNLFTDNLTRSLFLRLRK